MTMLKRHPNGWPTIFRSYETSNTIRLGIYERFDDEGETLIAHSRYSDDQGLCSGPLCTRTTKMVR